MNWLEILNRKNSNSLILKTPKISFSSIETSLNKFKSPTKLFLFLSESWTKKSISFQISKKSLKTLFINSSISMRFIYLLKTPFLIAKQYFVISKNTIGLIKFTIFITTLIKKLILLKICYKIIPKSSINPLSWFSTKKPPRKILQWF